MISRFSPAHDAAFAAVERALFPSITRDPMLKRFGVALEASAFGTFLLAWAVGYVLLCPPEPTHRAAPLIRGTAVAVMVSR